MSDGGVVALTGFLFQLLASGATILRSPVGQAVLALEPLDEDAAIIAGGKTTVYQFKFSSVGDEIGPGALADILTKLNEHTKHTPDSRWVLSTNRKLSEITKQLYDGQPVKDRKRSEANYDVINKLRTRLTIVEDNFDTAFTALRDEARRFGLSEKELSEGARHIVGELLTLGVGIGQGAEITRDQVTEILVGFKEPKELVAVARHADLAEALDRHHRDYVYPRALSEAFPRNGLERIFLDDAVVFVTGTGGAGKSTAVLRSVYDHLLSRKTMGLVLCSQNGTTIEETITSWRGGVDVRAPEQLDKCLDRLCIANAGSSTPFLFVVLDGIEEDGWLATDRAETFTRLQEHIREWPQRRKGMPPPKVIVTCRSMSMFQSHSYAGFDSKGSPDQNEIKLAELDDRELGSLWRAWLPQIPIPPNLLPELSEMEATDTAASTLTPELIMIFEMLRWPVFLRSLQALANDDMDQAAVALRGDLGAIHKMLSRYFLWFTQKVVKRSRISIDDTMGGLKAIARSTVGSGPFEKQAAWVRPCKDGGWMCDRDAERLFENAITCVLISASDAEAGRAPASEFGPAKWFWRYPLIRDYLAQLG